jgi:hypothetical protein
MIKVKLIGALPGQTMEIVSELRGKGYVSGVDFDFAYNQTVWDDMIGEIPRYTIFTFYRDELATWFELTYK